MTVGGTPHLAQVRDVALQHRVQRGAAGLLHVHEEEAVAYFRALCGSIAALEIPFRQRVLSLTVSIGICHRAGRDLYALLSEADRQLYLAKAAGRNRVALQSHVPA